MSIFTMLEEFLLPKGAKSSLSSYDFKRAMLTGYLSLICVLTAIFYAWVDISNGLLYAMPNYVALLVLALVSLVLTRRGKYTIAKVILMVSGNLVVFYSAIHDPFEAGVFMLFIPAGIGSFAILGFQERKKSLLLAIFSLVLFLIAYFSDLRNLVGYETSEEYARVSFQINYALSLLISVLIVYFLLRLNQQAEENLVAKELSLIEQNRQLEKVNKELDRFVYSVSHDLRSPLSSILGLTNLTRKATTEDERQEYLSMIEGRIRVQDQFIHDIIEYSRNVRTEIRLSKIDLTKLIQDTIENLAYIEGAQSIRFVVPEKAIVVESDLQRLTIVLSNLIGNAIKYHGREGTDRFVRVGCQRDGNLLRIEVEDNGRGIAPEYLSRVFDMFFRAEESSKGSGLGLYITKEAVAKLGGTIHLASERGKGSTFTVELPVSE